ncbi:hypothetical protein Ocin01_07235 [Orchesella cincta]|uniref:Uncharacterized protein n=1 Tax=Orchesella cincta TaxID=48709 RepID=A0A1D2N2C8_ORCCI|nr:hypothetical protein Ocin01_07235 [Orchesella cincta]
MLVCISTSVSSLSFPSLTESCWFDITIFLKMTSPSLCPHLVQEYFERVSDILTTYRPQILKQVEYDKISENLVLRGAVRHEEHEKIFQCSDLEGQTSQMLVVVQNRMWGLENLLASFMEEHISPWLTQEMFRAYMDHLVNPLKKQRDSQVCQCVQISNSILYRGWVKALKSLDSLILKTGTSLGFMRQSMYPQDNILAFLNEKLSEYTGGDSSSQDDLVPYGFAPNASGEVQVAELEEDDFNDLFSLSESLSIAYHANSNNGGAQQLSIEAAPTTIITENDSHHDKQVSTCTTPQPTQDENNITTAPEKSKGRPPLDPSRRRRSTDSSNTNLSEPPKASEKRLKQQQDLIARLSAPKSLSSSSNTPVRLRHSNSIDSVKLASKQRPRSAEFHRSTSASSPSPSQQSSPSTSTSTLSNVTGSSNTRPKSNKATTGKTTGFVRSKSAVPSSPKSRINKSSSKSKPTAVTKPNFKQGKISTDIEDNHDDAKRDSQSTNAEVDDVIETRIPDEQAFHKRSVSESDYVPFDPEDNEYEDEIELPAGISNLLLTNPIFGSKVSEDGTTQNFDYYQLTHFDSDDE